ncbi:hypothetical protein AMAG_14065 [Allomyces macrogynus ATCC 38327]|uniref:Uncharacterized protein n=1 Tax=Allomyces macrogynus (strain ATCC 38327) TaxID=578462 RepID=A0A0L0T4P9_ALLM3|nr:hypothetical protein AMAG_14065 [Allomyces macrogynus ATCC 38327]|eukprot:KNE69499.1 hypothetical protein AMAG_14065 [Allomyces macrogynus ATCC 38327]
MDATNSSSTNDRKRPRDAADADLARVDVAADPDLEPFATVLSPPVTLPPFLPLSATDAAVDPATQAVLQWQGPVSITFAPALARDAALSGTLSVTNPRLYFAPTDGPGIVLAYRAIVMHAVQGGSDRAIYCQLGINLKALIGAAWRAAGGQVVESADGQEKGEREEDDEFSELWIKPEDPDQLDTLFSDLSMCASMHPDPVDDEEDEDGLMAAFMGGGDGFFTADNVDDMHIDDLSPEGAANLARFEAMVDAAAAQFEDAEEDDDENANAN